MSIKVTVGVCVKNSEKIIKRALKSIAEQSFPHELMKLIVVDDGSNDRTFSVASDFISHIDIEAEIYRSGGKGLAFSRQMVVDNAKSDYLVWVDGDHGLPKDFIQKHVEFMENNPTIAAACGNEIFRGETLVALLESMTIAMKNRMSSSAVDVGGGVFRLQAIKEVGGFDTRLKGAGEDIEITNRIKKLGWKISQNSVEFYHYHRTTWKTLWDEYFWWGYGMHYVTHKQKHGRFSLTRMPVLTFVIGLKHSIACYKLFHQKKAFLLPFQYSFKNFSFCLGFAKSHLDRHGHLGNMEKFNFKIKR